MIECLVLAAIAGFTTCEPVPVSPAGLSPRDARLLQYAPQPPAGMNPEATRVRTFNTTGEILPGTIVVDNRSRSLFYIESDAIAIRYPVGIGRRPWRGISWISRKAEWPAWFPGPNARKIEPDLPSAWPGGPDNPLGARALYLNFGKRDSGFRIHGTDEPEKIGQTDSLGCIRMHNIDVIDLYSRAKIGARVVVR